MPSTIQDLERRLRLANLAEKAHDSLTGVTADQHHTHATVLSPPFSVDAPGVRTVTIPHGLGVAPAVEDCQLTVVEVDAVDDWGEDFVKVVSTDAANVVAKVNVTTASGTGGATARLALHVSLI